MELKLRCTVSHGIGWNGGVREYNGVVNVELSEQEMEQLKSARAKHEKEHADFDVEDEFPEIFGKIERKSFDFKVYTLVLDTCVRWNTEYGDVCEEDLIEEDIQLGKFVPLYVNAEGSSRDALIMNQWFIWLVESVKDLSYREQADYLIQRYKMELPTFDEVEFETTYSVIE